MSQEPKYVLHVDVTLNAGSARKSFEEAVVTFLNDGGFKRLVDRPSLVPAYLLRKATDKGTATYLHKWTVPSVEDLNLAALMHASEDDIPYKAIDQYVASETQEFTCVHPFDRSTPAGRAIKVPPPPHEASSASSARTPPSRYVHVVHQFAKASDYGLYESITDNLVYYMAKVGWYSAGIAWNVTGKLRTYTELWRVDRGPVDDNAETMLGLLRSVFPKTTNPAPGAYVDVPKYYQQLSAGADRAVLDEYAYNDANGRWVRA